MNNILKKLLEYLAYPLLMLVIVSLLLTFVVDSISRGSISESFNFISSKEITFLFNTLIIFLTLSITLLTKRKTFSYCLISFIWIIISIGNKILLSLRGTPLTGSDLKLIKSGLKLINNYMSKQEIIYIVIALFFILALLVLIFIFAPKTKLKINYIFSLALIFIIFLTYKECNSLALSNSIVSNNFWDLNAVYKENGFIYCFSTPLLNNGVSKPESYSQNSIESILYSLNDSKTVNSKAPYSDISYSSDEKFPNNDEAQYLDALKSIEYDILAGNEYLYNYISKPVATNLKFGSKSNVWWSSSFISNPNLINNAIKLSFQVT